MTDSVADLEGGRAGSGPPFGRQTDAVTVLLTSQHGGVLWRRYRQLTYKQVTMTHQSLSLFKPGADWGANYQRLFSTFSVNK